MAGEAAEGCTGCVQTCGFLSSNLVMLRISTVPTDREPIVGMQYSWRHLRLGRLQLCSLAELVGVSTKEGPCFENVKVF